MELAPKKRPAKNEVVPAKRTNVKAIDRYIATQDNCLIYAKYHMVADAMKLFMYMVAKIDSRENRSFEECTMTIWEIKEMLGHTYVNITHIKKLINGIFDQTINIVLNNKERDTLYKAIIVFDYILYKAGGACIIYKLHDDLRRYLLNLKTNFTQIQFKDIREMRSSYSIRIYNMLMCEICQNRTSLKMEVEILQNILKVPPSLKVWGCFNREILEKAKKDINGYSNISLLNIKTYKTGRKITEIEFIFDYKNNRARICRDVNKQQHYVDMLIEEVDKHLSGKSICITGNKRIREEDKHNIYTIKDRRWSGQEQCILITCEQARSSFYKGQTKPRTEYLAIKSMSDIEKLKQLKERAEGVYHAYIANPQEERKKIKPQSKSDKVNELLEKAVNKFDFFQRK